LSQNKKLSVINCLQNNENYRILRNITTPQGKYAANRPENKNQHFADYVM